MALTLHWTPNTRLTTDAITHAKAPCRALPATTLRGLLAAGKVQRKEVRPWPCLPRCGPQRDGAPAALARFNMEWSLDGIIEEALSVIRKLTACALATTAVAAVVLAALIGAVDHDQCQGVFGSDGGRSDLAWLLRSGSGSLCNTKRALMARKGLVTDFAAKRATAYLAVTVLLSLPALWYFRAAKQRQTEQTAALWWPAQVAVVTGGRGGLGTALVGALLKAGCGKVVSVDCSDTKVLAGSTRGHVTQLTCDVSRAESVQRTADHIRAHIGAPTILISNAGVMVGKRVLDLDEGDFEQYVMFGI